MSSDQVTRTGATSWPILLVDDDPDIRQTLEWLFEDEGHEVVSAADGFQALLLAAERRPALVLLDMGLPLLDGTEVARRLGELYDDRPPIVVLTADGRAAEKARRVGAANYLHKPFDLEELLQIVQRLTAPR